MGLLTCNGLLAQNNSTYSQLIEEADLYLKVGDTGFARIDYEKAIQMNPADEYPRLKLAEIVRKESTQHRNDSIFEQTLLNAEKYFKSGNYNLAQIEYRRSLELKPESTFVKGRLALISGSDSKSGIPKAEIPKTDNSLASLKSEPTETIAEPKTDNSLASLKSETTKTISGPKTENSLASLKSEPEKTISGPKADLSKQEIINDKPIAEPSVKGNNQPKAKTPETRISTETLATTITPLQTALTQAEEFFNAKDYENAAQRYQAALLLKPNDKAIKTKLATAKTLLDKQKKDQKAYSDIILAAEKASTQKNTPQAITLYEQAASMKPEEVIVQNKLTTLRDKLLVEQNQDKDFKDYISKADQLLHDNKLQEAKKSYELARTIKPEEKYPQEKLLDISHIEAVAASEKLIKYKETLVLAESLLAQEDFQGAFQAFSLAVELQPQESYPKQKVTELSVKLKALDAQYKIAYNGYITDAGKAFQARNWDIAMDNYLKALKAKSNDTLAGNQIGKIISYMDSKSVATLMPPTPVVLEGKEVKLPFKVIEKVKKRNQYLVVHVKNSASGTPRLYIGYGQDGQKNGAIIYRNLLKGGQYIDYVVRIANQDRWYRLDNNWISLTVEGGSLEIDKLKICSDF